MASILNLRYVVKDGVYPPFKVEGGRLQLREDFGICADLTSTNFPDSVVKGIRKALTSSERERYLVVGSENVFTCDDNFTVLRFVGKKGPDGFGVPKDAYVSDAGDVILDESGDIFVYEPDGHLRGKITDVSGPRSVIVTPTAEPFLLVSSEEEGGRLRVYNPLTLDFLGFADDPKSPYTSVKGIDFISVDKGENNTECFVIATREGERATYLYRFDANTKKIFLVTVLGFASTSRRRPEQIFNCDVVGEYILFCAKDEGSNPYFSFIDGETGDVICEMGYSASSGVPFAFSLPIYGCISPDAKEIVIYEGNGRIWRMSADSLKNLSENFTVFYEPSDNVGDNYENVEILEMASPQTVITEEEVNLFSINPANMQMEFRCSGEFLGTKRIPETIFVRVIVR